MIFSRVNARSTVLKLTFRPVAVSRMLDQRSVRMLVQLLKQLLFMLRLKRAGTPARFDIHPQQPLIALVQIPLNRLEMHPVLLRGLFDSHPLAYYQHDALPQVHPISACPRSFYILIMTNALGDLHGALQ